MISTQIALYFIAFFVQLAIFLYEWWTHHHKGFIWLVPVFFIGNLAAYIAYYEATS